MIYEISLGDLNKDYEPMKSTILYAFRQKTKFQLNIDTSNIEHISMYFLYDFSKFLFSLKNEKQYLEKTNLYVYNEYVYHLLEHFFIYICKPIAKVQLFLYENNELKYLKSFYP